MSSGWLYRRRRETFQTNDPKAFLGCHSSFKIAMMEGVIKRAICIATFVFYQQVFITCMGHCSPWDLVDDMENKINGMADDNPGMQILFR